MTSKEQIELTARTEAERASASARSAASEFADAARAKGREAGNALADEARRRGEEAKAATAAEINTVSEAFRRAARDLQTGSPQERTFGYLADNLATVSDTVRDKDVGEMLEDVTAFARRNPLAFLGGAALLGFAITRFSRATQQREVEDDRRGFADPAYASATSPSSADYRTTGPTGQSDTTGRTYSPGTPGSAASTTSGSSDTAGRPYSPGGTPKGTL